MNSISLITSDILHLKDRILEAEREGVRVLNSLLYLNEETNTEIFKKLLEQFKTKTCIKQEESKFNLSFEAYKQLALHLEKGFDDEIFLEFKKDQFRLPEKLALIRKDSITLFKELNQLNLNEIEEDTLVSIVNAIKALQNSLNISDKINIAYLLPKLPVNYRHLEELPIVKLIKSLQSEFKELGWLYAYVEEIKNLCSFIETMRQHANTFEWNLKARQMFVKE